MYITLPPKFLYKMDIKMDNLMDNLMDIKIYSK